MNTTAVVTVDSAYTAIRGVAEATKGFVAAKFALQKGLYDAAVAMKKANMKDISKNLRACFNTLPDDCNPYLKIGDHHCDLIVGAALQGVPFQTCKGPYSGT